MGTLTMENVKTNAVFDGLFVQFDIYDFGCFMFCQR